MQFDDIKLLLEYHYWARDRLLAAVESLTHEQLTADRQNSFKSIHDTLVHLYGAEWIWCARWEGASPTALPSSGTIADFSTLRKAWAEQEARVRAVVSRLGEDGVQRPLAYQGLDGKPQAQPFWQMFQHLVNHGSYHRGQVTTMLRQMGMPAPKSMDLIAFYRERNAVRA